MAKNCLKDTTPSSTTAKYNIEYIRIVRFAAWYVHYAAFTTSSLMSPMSASSRKWKLRMKQQSQHKALLSWVHSVSSLAAEGFRKLGYVHNGHVAAALVPWKVSR